MWNAFPKKSLTEKKEEQNALYHLKDDIGIIKETNKGSIVVVWENKTSIRKCIKKS